MINRLYLSLDKKRRAGQRSRPIPPDISSCPPWSMEEASCSMVGLSNLLGANLLPSPLTLAW
jgi:hypothetical protein